MEPRKRAEGNEAGESREIQQLCHGSAWKSCIYIVPKEALLRLGRLLCAPEEMGMKATLA